MQTIRLLSLTLLITAILPCYLVTASIYDMNIEELVEESDVIVEGWSQPNVDRADRNIPVYVADHKQAITVGHGSVKQTTFKIVRSYKGSFKQLSIPVYSYPKIEKKSVSLIPKRKYILFLKKHPHKNGYIILNSGRAQWMVFNYNGKLKVKAWNQAVSYRETNTYQDYHDIVSQLKWQMSSNQ